METIKININSPIKDNLYYEINTGLSLDADDIRLGNEDVFGYDFIDDLKSSLVPDVIDMERIKFVPGIVNGNDKMLANKLNFYLHFIKRKEIPNDENEYKERALNSIYTSGNVYYDTWHIDPDTRETTWWNEYDNKSNFFNEESFSKFYENNSKKSDLIGYLNFTDNDIFYRKKKVSQSFIRLLFYNSPDPIEQKLLYYSTVFLDGGELYGKYIKQLVSLQKEIQKNASIGTNRRNENTFIVMYSGGTRVDSKISVTHEYDKTKSAEGFNLYLFKENYSDITGQTIYMKVEFNHAGNGKTTPLIIWPKNNNKFCGLTTDNFIESLYTKVLLHFDENSERFIYSFPNVESEDGDIEFILYEPKLDMVLKDVEDGQHDSESQPETPVIKPKYNVYFIDKKTSHIVKSFNVEENTKLGTLVDDEELQNYITELEKTNIVKLVYVNGGNDIYEGMLIKKDVKIYIDYTPKEVETVKYYVKIVDDTNEDGIFDYTVVDGFYDEGTILGDIKIMVKLGNKNILGNHINTNVNSIVLGAEAMCPADLICVRADTGACGTRDLADVCPLDETCKDDLCLEDGICLIDDCDLNNLCDCYDCSDIPQPCDGSIIIPPTGCTAVSITPTGCTLNDTGVTATTLSEYISQLSEGGYVIDLIDDNDNIIDISTTVTKDLNLHIRRKKEESEEPMYRQ